ncbi:MAG TPA: hypothetical protein VD963_03950 [Phycisphaerales bacterium]|nr:hypothetical protein [Phycisphaerales bacterium]
MHDRAATGNDFFKCDFCRRSWSEERPMVEGHRGSLLCAACLTVAYTHVVVAGGGEELRGSGCTLCLEERDQPQWQSPMYPEARACLRCIKQAATVLEKDPDAPWTRPAADRPPH